MIVNTERKLPDEAALGSSIQPAQHFQMCKSGIFGEGGCKSSALTIKDHLRFLSPYDRQDIFYCHIFWGRVVEEGGGSFSRATVHENMI